MSSPLRVEYCGEWSTVEPGERFTVGRVADLSVDDNPYLHRHFLALWCEHGVWLLANVGTQLSATVGDDEGQFLGHVAPGGVVPLAFATTHVRFGAGPTTYELRLVLPDAPFATAAVGAREDVGAGGSAPAGDGLAAPTQAPAELTDDQRLLVLALAEHALRRTSTGPSALPASAEGARRLGWSERKFHKKLDQVCQKLAKAGVRGLHGGPGDIASNRRARLVEYCLASRLVVADDLPALDAPHADDG